MKKSILLLGGSIILSLVLISFISILNITSNHLEIKNTKSSLIYKTSKLKNENLDLKKENLNLKLENINLKFVEDSLKYELVTK